MAISSKSMANNNDEIIVKSTRNQRNKVEYNHQSTETVIDLCCSEDDEDDDVELVTSNISSGCISAAAASTTSAVNRNDDHSSNVCQTSVASSNSLDVISSSSSCSKCVVCGSSLQHISTLQSRVLHLKQCSKKYGIQARDFRRNYDDNDDEEEKMEIGTNTSTTTLHHQQHQQQQSTNLCVNRQKTSSEPRTLNTFLMDNARRLAKCKEITNKNNTLNKTNSNKNVVLKKGTKSTWKRRPFQVRIPIFGRVCVFICTCFFFLLLKIVLPSFTNSIIIIFLFLFPLQRIISSRTTMVPIALPINV